MLTTRCYSTIKEEETSWRREACVTWGQFRRRGPYSAWWSRNTQNHLDQTKFLKGCLPISRGPYRKRDFSLHNSPDFGKRFKCHIRNSTSSLLLLLTLLLLLLSWILQLQKKKNIMSIHPALCQTASSQEVNLSNISRFNQNTMMISMRTKTATKSVKRVMACFT